MARLSQHRPPCCDEAQRQLRQPKSPFHAGQLPSRLIGLRTPSSCHASPARLLGDASAQRILSSIGSVALRASGLVTWNATTTVRDDGWARFRLNAEAQEWDHSCTSVEGSRENEWTCRD